ncbi:hypothetical protein KIV56_15755 [Cryobacterium breve]|uniref:Uncharacterized protein n=1 Tax=Cryobacterium breve TaxID=1259258 RepID=A0ABY7NAZ9_9MICO|nr:hypothetical protein [Cryobacterium breve]WBM79684.1 hypothetical protein KIV56_15755 [Cryobacterium breve]
MRSAWQLEIGSVPKLDSEPEPGTSRRPDDLDLDAAVQRWLTEWRRAWSHFDAAEPAVGIPDEEVQRLLDTLTDEEPVGGDLDLDLAVRLLEHRNRPGGV